MRNEKRKLAAASEKENREKQLADAEELDRSFAESVRFDGESVYCQHLRPLNGKCVIKDRALWENPTSGGQPQQHRACEIVHAEVVDSSTVKTSGSCRCQWLPTACLLPDDDYVFSRHCIRYVFRPVRTLPISQPTPCA